MCSTVKRRIAGLYILSLLVLNPFGAKGAEWQMSLQHAGFMGDISVAGGFENEARWFGLEIGMGQSRDSDGTRVRQYNVKTRFQPWIVGLGKYGALAPYAGLQLMYTDDTDFFVRSGSEFPEEEYYDFTAIRVGVPLGIAWRFRQWAIYGEYVILDTDVIAQYNSNSELPYQDIVSAALGLRYYF